MKFHLHKISKIKVISAASFRKSTTNKDSYKTIFKIYTQERILMIMLVLNK